jgi:hypothetical protein
MPKLFSITNLIIAISLGVILLLVYNKNKSFELFGADASGSTTTKAMITVPKTTTAKTTIPLLNNDTIQNSALVNFINRYITNKNQQSVYSATLAARQETISANANQVLNLINPSS